MNAPVEMPRLGNTVEEHVITRWMKHKGAPGRQRRFGGGDRQQSNFAGGERNFLN